MISTSSCNTNSEINSLIPDEVKKERDIFKLDKPVLGEPVVICKNIRLPVKSMTGYL